MEECILQKRLNNVLLVSDIDGTLINHDFKIPKRNIEAIQRFRDEGGIFCIASGRPMVSARQYTDLLKIDTPCLLVNGSVIYDWCKKEIIWSKAIPRESLKYVDLVQRKFPDIGIEAITKDKINIIKSNDKVIAHVQNENLNCDVVSFDDLQEDIYKVLFAAEKNIIEEVYEYTKTLDSQNVRFVKTSNIFFEMIPYGISKGAALKNLMEILNVRKEDTFAVGDYYNDIEMFSEAGVGAVVKDAPDEVKKHADIVVCSCDDGAVADTIEYIEKKYLA